jgi:hypothetical protein
MQQEAMSVHEEGGGELGGQNEPINKRQIDGSQGTFEAMIRKTNSEIDGIKRQNERKEKDRRFDEELARQKRYENIQNEAQMAARKLAELEMRWSEYKEMEECQELAQSLGDHKKMFGELVNGKTNLINSLQTHIKDKDAEYMREMEAMKDDIDLLVIKIRTQFRDLRDLVGSELVIVEDDLNRQRGERLSKMQDEISEKFRNLREVEKNSTEQR